MASHLSDLVSRVHSSARRRDAPRQVARDVKPLHHVLQRGDAEVAFAGDGGHFTGVAAAARVGQQAPRVSRLRHYCRRQRWCSRAVPTRVQRDSQRRGQQAAVRRRQHGLEHASASSGGAPACQRRDASVLVRKRARLRGGGCAPGVCSASVPQLTQQRAPHRVGRSRRISCARRFKWRRTRRCLAVESQGPAVRRRPRMPVVHKSDPMADKDFVLNRHSLANH